MRITFIAVVVGLGGPLTAWAEDPRAPVAQVDGRAATATGELRGRVRVAGEPVIGATVTLQGSLDGALTEADGSFVLPGVPTGQVALVIEAPGYGRYTEVVTVRPGAGSFADLALAVEAAVGEEIVITGTRAPEKRLDSPVNLELVSDQDIVRAPGVSYLAALSNLKGIDYAQAGVNEQRVSARGFSSQFNSRMITLLDGRLAQLPGNGLPQGNLLPATPLDMKAVEVVVGPASALYGPNAHTGVINVSSKSPWDEAGAALLVRGGGREMVSGAARVAGTLADRLGWKLNGEALRADDFLPARGDVVGDDGVARDPFAYGTDAVGAGVHERDLVADHAARSLKGDGSLYYRAGDVMLKGSYGHGVTDGFSLTNAGRNHIRGWTVDYQSVQLTSPSLYAQVTRTASDAGRSYQLNRLAGAVAAMGGLEAFSRAELDALRDSIKFVDRSQMIDAELQYRFGWRRLQTTVGAGYRLYLPSSEGTYLSDADDPIRATELGGYAQLDYHAVPDKLRLVGAARADHHSDYPTQLSPSATAVYSVTERHNLRLGYQRAFKAPTILENHLLIGGNLVGNATGFEIRDAGGQVISTIDPLEPEQVDSVELGYKGVVSDRLFVDAVVYNSWYRSFISPLTQVANPMPTDPAIAPTFGFYPDGTPVAEGTPAEGSLFTYSNFGRAYARGADLGATFSPLDGLSLNAGVSLIQLVSFDAAPGQAALLLNVPTVKLKGAVTISGLVLDHSFLRLAGRWHDAHRFESGYWSSARFGEVSAGLVADLTAGYEIPSQGLAFELTCANLLDNREPDVLGAPTPRRFAFLQASYRFDGLRL